MPGNSIFGDGGIEPAAISSFDRAAGEGKTPVMQVALQASQAISLRRIADALEKLAGGPLNAYGEGIGECIQGQHERGLRGIPNP